MEEKIMDEGLKTSNVFNTTFETGVRTLIILEALYPRPCGLSDLTWFDHLVVHTKGVGGPESLHPDLESSVGELLVRRRLVNKSLKLLQQLHLIDVDYDDEGVTYLPGEEAPAFLDLLSTSYNQRLKECATWVANKYGALSSSEIIELFEDRVVRWTTNMSKVAISS